MGKKTRSLSGKTKRSHPEKLQFAQKIFHSEGTAGGQQSSNGWRETMGTQQEEILPKKTPLIPSGTFTGWTVFERVVKKTKRTSERTNSRGGESGKTQGALSRISNLQRKKGKAYP